MQSARPVHENLGELSHALSRENMVLYFNNNLLKKAKPRFCLFPSICRKAHGKGEAAALCNMCALKKLNGVPENRNARSGVRFLGIRSNKCTRAWRQATRTACPPSPCCDVPRGESRSGFPSDRTILQPSARREIGEQLSCAFENRVSQKAHPICRIPATFAGKVKPHDFIICVHLFIARRGKLRRLAALPRAAGLSSNHGKKF